MSQTISNLVQSQFPEFVQEDYPALIAFIQAYYEYLELQKNPQDILTNLIAYTDIDRTLDEFVAKFEKTYLNGLPMVVAGDKRLFMKHVNDLYNTKGTEESFRLLFRLLFNEEIEIYYPKQQMLRTSSGVWQQNNSIMVQLDAGISSDCINKKIKIWTNEGVINTFVKNIVLAAPSIYEVFIDKSFSIPIQPGNRVTGLAFAATILPTVTQATVTAPGAGFHVGQVFNINSVQGSGATVKVTRVDPNGGIVRLAFIQFGTGFEADFMLSLSSAVRKSGVIDPYSSYTHGFIEDVLVTRVSYFAQDYVDVTYSGEVIGSSYTNDYIPDNALAPTVTPAEIEFSLGALCAYRGEYTTADGFLSDINVIQDGYLYQDFSYVIQSQQKIQAYASAVKKLCHPAGTIMWGQMSLETEVDVGISYDYFKVLAEQLKFLEFVTSGDASITITSGKGMTDHATSGDLVPVKAVGKALTDASTTVDAISFKTTKPLTDASTPTDAIALKTGKALTDSSAPTDAIAFSTSKPFSDSSAPTDAIKLNTGRTLSDASTPVDAIKLTTGKGLTDAATSGDAVITLKTTKALTDATAPTDAITKSTFRRLADATTPTDAIALNTTRPITGDAVSTSDSLSALYIDYADGSYFAQAYVGTVIST
jgi:hypothetical protein